MITVKQRGDLKKLDKFFKKSIKISEVNNLSVIAERCIARLKEVTPKDSGLTAESWGYNILQRKNFKVLQIYNTNIQNGAKIALLIEYGHASRNGSWVQGKHFITPTMQEEYNKILNTTWKEMKKL